MRELLASRKKETERHRLATDMIPGTAVAWS